MAAGELTRHEQLRASLDQVTTRIDALVAEHHRVPGSVRLLPVTKFHPASDIGVLYELGCREVGENREQEARAKATELPEVGFHMIGQIQTKKANSVARWARCVHSVDSVKLVDALDRGVALAIDRGDRAAGLLDCFVQLSMDGDVSRGGVPLDSAHKVAETLASSTHLRLSGVMCVPPKESEPRESFAAAAEVRDSWESSYERSLEFSAGMSGDVGEAIAAGSTLVRVGTAILGPRPIV